MRQQYLSYPFQRSGHEPQIMITSMKKNLKMCKMLWRIRYSSSPEYPLIRWGTHCMVPARALRALLCTARHHPAVVGEGPVRILWRIIAADRLELKQHSWALLGTAVGKETALPQELHGCRAARHKEHPSVFLTLPYTEKCGISK